MTAQEKAAELYAKMKGFRIKHSHAKKCAIIACEEIINSHPKSSLRDWYIEVRSELEKIKTP